MTGRGRLAKMVVVAVVVVTMCCVAVTSSGYDCENNNPCVAMGEPSQLYMFPASAGPAYYVQCGPIYMDDRQCNLKACPSGQFWYYQLMRCD